ncbi:hypothetical protein H4P1_00080 (plasmid) [Variovorax sp. PBS-H4]|uniref:hypothetical protein n=1 Tax=Variovorax sp. PBS-H4 TaxID=434008 RepID=UPI00131704D3|nr:hypothetical protein [Variovorax sp. PBS-H4]VTU41465.1 hypothetical protein H4P1_00080 [Variovorax sp. PBS-H4]
MFRAVYRQYVRSSSLTARILPFLWPLILLVVLAMVIFGPVAWWVIPIVLVIMGVQFYFIRIMGPGIDEERRRLGQ